MEQEVKFARTAEEFMSLVLKWSAVSNSAVLRSYQDLEKKSFFDSSLKERKVFVGRRLMCRFLINNPREIFLLPASLRKKLGGFEVSVEKSAEIRNDSRMKMLYWKLKAKSLMLFNIDNLEKRLSPDGSFFRTNFDYPEIEND